MRKTSRKHLVQSSEATTTLQGGQKLKITKLWMARHDANYQKQSAEKRKKKKKKKKKKQVILTDESRITATLIDLPLLPSFIPFFNSKPLPSPPCFQTVVVPRGEAKKSDLDQAAAATAVTLLTNTPLYCLGQLNGATELQQLCEEKLSGSILLAIANLPRHKNTHKNAKLSKWCTPKRSTPICCQGCVLFPL